MDMDKKIHNIIVDLDSLLDTRLPLAGMLSENNVSKMIKDGSYYLRTRDNFNNIPADLFHVFYRRRNKQILKYSLPTKITGLINELSRSYLREVTSRGLPIVYINTFPYKLTEEENKYIEVMCRGMLNTRHIEIVHMDTLTELTPKWVRNNIHNIIMYDGMRWLENHSARYAFAADPLIETTLFVPAIVYGKMKQRLDVNYFNTLSSVLKGTIKLVFLDSVHFSIWNKKRIDTAP